ncbi:MAG: NUDIX hydrolase [Rhizobiales bacterium]|nr:NUDIX hydrolase [Hyphomicrobiales bacterium]
MIQIIEPPASEIPDQPHPNQPIKPASSLLILDMQNGQPHVLMGCRSKKHAFMPNVYVFPGGRVDGPDKFAPFATDITPATLAQLQKTSPKNKSGPIVARAFALAALRETFEESGLLISKPAAAPNHSKNLLWQPFLSHGQLPDLSQLRYLARAVTPPGRIRRYDTRFFTVPREAVELELENYPTNELENQIWVPIKGGQDVKIPWITRRILAEVESRISSEQSLSLSDKAQIPVYAMHYGRHTRQLI